MGTYELFRHFFALPSHVTSRGEEVAPTRGVLRSIVSMLESGVTHMGVATDHVIESFRNGHSPGYKTSEGVDPRLLAQFTLLEDTLQSMGVVVWPMVELEADDALAGRVAELAAALRPSSHARLRPAGGDRDSLESPGISPLHENEPEKLHRDIPRRNSPPCSYQSTSVTKMV